MEQKLGAYADLVQIIKTFSSPFEAALNINALKPDVVFLDIEMPGMNGFQFLQQIGEFDFEVIFVTAYDAYTIDALRANALDYLLKPVEDDQLHNAIIRLQKRVPQKIKLRLEPPEKVNPGNRIALFTAEGIHLVKKSDILRIEAMSNYSTFHLIGARKIVVSRSLKEYEDSIKDINFYRVNRSTIVNLNYVTRYRKGEGGTLELNDGMEIEVSSSRKEDLMDRLLNS